MPSLLHLDSSADATTSRSRVQTTAFADANLHWPARLRPADANPSADDKSLPQALIEELPAADVLLVGAPLVRLLDAVEPQGGGRSCPRARGDGAVRRPSQPLAGRTAVLVSSRGASDDAGSPTDGWDHAGAGNSSG